MFFSPTFGKTEHVLCQLFRASELLEATGRFAQGLTVAVLLPLATRVELSPYALCPFHNLGGKGHILYLGRRMARE